MVDEHAADNSQKFLFLFELDVKVTIPEFIVAVDNILTNTHNFVEVSDNLDCIEDKSVAFQLIVEAFHDHELRSVRGVCSVFDKNMSEAVCRANLLEEFRPYLCPDGSDTFEPSDSDESGSETGHSSEADSDFDSFFDRHRESLQIFPSETQ
jgi:hypothetical protein